MSVTLLGNDVFANDHIKTKTLRWTLIQQDSVLIKRENTYTERRAHMENATGRETTGFEYLIKNKHI